MKIKTERRITIRLTQEEYKQIKAYSKKARIPMSEVCRRAVASYLTQKIASAKVQGI